MSISFSLIILLVTIFNWRKQIYPVKQPSTPPPPQIIEPTPTHINDDSNQHLENEVERHTSTSVISSENVSVKSEMNIVSLENTMKTFAQISLLKHEENVELNRTVRSLLQTIEVDRKSKIEAKLFKKNQNLMNWLLMISLVMAVVTWTWTLQRHSTTFSISSLLQNSISWWANTLNIKSGRSSYWFLGYLGIDMVLSQAYIIGTGVIVVIIFIIIAKTFPKVGSLMCFTVLVMILWESAIRLLFYYMFPLLVFYIIGFPKNVSVPSNRIMYSLMVVIYGFIAGYFAALTDPLNIERKDSYIDILLALPFVQKIFENLTLLF